MQQIDRDALLTSTGRFRRYTTDTVGREPYRILEKRDVIPPKNTLHAWLRVSMPAVDLTIVIDGVGLHIKGSKVWCSPPGAAWVKNNELVRGQGGKPIYTAVVSFSHGGHRLWSEQIVRVLRTQYPDLVAPSDDDRAEADEAQRWWQGRGAP